MKWVSHYIFSSGSRQEVNITWYPEIDEPIKSRGKHYSLVLYILTPFIVPILIKAGLHVRRKHSHKKGERQ